MILITDKKLSTRFKKYEYFSKSKFELELSLGGLFAGSLEGEIELIWGKTDFKPIPTTQLRRKSLDNQ